MVRRGCYRDGEKRVNAWMVRRGCYRDGEKRVMHGW